MPTLSLTPAEKAHIQALGEPPSLSGFLRCLATVADQRASSDDRRRANDRLANQYRARATNPWTAPDRPDEVRSLSATSGISGGFLLPETVAPTVAAIAERSLIRRRATIVEMDAVKVRVPTLRPITPTTPGQTPFYGGFNPEWMNEDTATLPEADPEFGAAELVISQLCGSFAVPRRLIFSTTNFDALAAEIMGGAVAAIEEWAFFNGNGNGKPLGILNSDALVTTAARASGTAIADADIHAAWAKMLPSSKPSAVWASGVAAEEKALASIGSDVRPAPADSAAAYSYLGRPWVATEKLPGLNTAGDLVAIDPRYYLVGNGGTEIAASPHFDFRHGLIWFRVVHLVAGMPWVNEALTLTDGTTTVSPFVALAPSA